MTRMETNSPRPIKFLLSESEFLEIYNQVPSSLAHQVIGVGITAESLSGQSSVLLQKQNNGNYWIIKTDGNQHWLLPKGKKKFNSHEYSTLESLFECKGYSSEGGRNFIVKKPAKVISNSNEKDWKLEEKGVLDFIEFSPLTELETKIEQAQQEQKYLLSELQVTKKELAETKNKLTQSEDECHKLRSRLETSEDECRQIVSLFRNLQNQVNQQQQERQNLWDLLIAERQEKEKLQSQINEIAVIANKGVQLKNSSTKDINIGNIQELKQQIIPGINPIAAEVRSQQDATSIISPETQELPEKAQSSEPSDSLILTKEEQLFVSRYNEGTDLSNYTTEVSPTQDTVEEGRTGRDQIAYLKPDPSGMYWIIKGNEGIYLVPNRNRKFNTHQMNSGQDLCDCHDYQAGTTDPKNFKLVKPGKVAAIIVGKTWVLQSKGILKFQ